jgi:hypothetical protein
MDISIFFLLAGILCILIAIIFFRKSEVSVSKILFPFMMSLYSPHKMKEDIKSEGILIIILGYLLWCVALYFFAQ